MNLIVRSKVFRISILVAQLFIILVGCSLQSKVFPTPTNQNATLSVKTVPTVEPSVTPTTIPSLTPEIITTEYPIKQLSPEEKKRKVAEILRTNNQCTLPCLMGIKLSESSLADIKKLLYPYMGEGLITKHQSAGSFTYGSGFETSNLIRSSFKVHLSEDKTDGIDLYLGGLWRSDVKKEDWMPFTLSGVLKQLGPPSQVRFYLTLPPSDKSIQGVSINTVLYYEAMKIVVVYYGQVIEESPELQFCPMQQQPEYMVMHIGTYAEEDTIVGISLEDASSLSINDFYSIDWDNPRSCIILKKDSLKSSN